MRKFLGIKVHLCTAALVFAGMASANVIPTFTTDTGGGSLFTYNYSVATDSFQEVVTGDQLCFADVPDLTGSATAPTNWTAVQTPANACPFNAGVTKPNVPGSILYTYNGTATIGPSTMIGTFTFQDTSGTTGQIAFGATSVKTSDNAPTANQGEVVGPTAIPEPGTLGLFIGAGLLGLTFCKTRRT